MNKNLPRGIRNNNPGNIRIANNNWQGKVPVSENTDGDFEQFYKMEMGVRALTKLGWTYLRQNPNHTILSFIEKYAPNNENNSLAYAETVASRLGVSIEHSVNDIYTDVSNQYLFILAIIRHENGIAFDNQEISDGVELGNA